ncbi:MAG: FHA domain-containing protein [Lachnospiraceae bacterium]|nr:FHA domain-containing protein [Lachnospiraceae bacterium]
MRAGWDVGQLIESITEFLEAYGLILAIAAGIFIALIVLIVIIVVVSKNHKKKAPVGNDYAGLDQQLRNQRVYNGGMPQGYPPVQVNVPPQGYPPVQVNVPPQGYPSAQVNVPPQSASTGQGAAHGTGSAPAPGPVQVVVSVPGNKPVQEPASPASPANGFAPIPGNGQPAGIMSRSENPVLEKEKTHILFDSQGAQSAACEHKVTLTCMADPGRVYMCRIVDKIVIGRNPACCDIAVSTDNAVSERHCEISFTDNRFYIRDIGSSNGTSMNGCIVGSVTQIRSGDIVKMGRMEYRVTLE